MACTQDHPKLRLVPRLPLSDFKRLILPVIPQTEPIEKSIKGLILQNDASLYVYTDSTNCVYIDNV